MELIKIPKRSVIELIKNNECGFYESDTYTDIKVKVDWKETQLNDDNLYITEDALADLLFDKIYSSAYLTIIIV